jgi:drug/metabolite transporter (DMT)-like permease
MISLRQSLDAILYAGAGWFLFCLLDAAAKWLSGGYSAFQIMACIGIVGSILSGGWLVFRHGYAGFATPKWKLFLCVGVLQSLSSILVVKAVSLIQLADFYGVIFLTPLAITLMAGLFLKEKIGLDRILPLVIGFIGVLIIAGPSFSSQGLGYLYCLGVVIADSINAMLFRKIGDDPVMMRFAFYPLLMVAVINTPLVLLEGFKLPVNAVDASLLIFMAPFFLIAFVAYSTGFSKARQASIVAPFHYTQMVWGSLLGFFIFNDIPAWTTFAGSALIIASGLIIIRQEQVHYRDSVDIL